MFYILRFYLESKIPQALSIYSQKFYCWTTDPASALAFATKDGAEAGLADIQRRSATSTQYRFVVVNVSEVPIGSYQGSGIQGFLAW